MRRVPDPSEGGRSLLCSPQAAGELGQLAKIGPAVQRLQVRVGLDQVGAETVSDGLKQVDERQPGVVGVRLRGQRVGAPYLVKLVGVVGPPQNFARVGQGGIAVAQTGVQDATTVDGGRVLRVEAYHLVEDGQGFLRSP